MVADSVDDCRFRPNPDTLSPAERADAVDRVTARVDAVRAAAGDRLPVARPHGGDWLLGRRGSWSAGCWVASLRLRALVLGTEDAAEQAREGVHRLSRSLDEDTSARATVFWLGTAAWDGVPDAVPDGAYGRADAVEAARRVAGSFDAGLGAVPDGTALGHGEAGRHSATIDAAFAIVRLLHWADSHRADGNGVDGAAGIARRHAGTLLGGVRADGRADAWARGQAWTLLAAVAAGTATGTPHPAAAALARYATGLPVPPPDRSDGAPGPDGAGSPVDTGAAAIEAYALLGLGGHRVRAESLVATLVRHHLDDDGALLDGTYRLGPGGAEPVESVWGNFFLLAALLTLDDRLPPGVF